MKLKPNLKVLKVADDYVVVATGAEAIDFSKMITLNQAAAYIWQSVEGKDFEIEDIVKAILSEYDIDEETATNDAEEFVETLLQGDFVTV